MLAYLSAYSSVLAAAAGLASAALFVMFFMYVASGDGPDLSLRPRGRDFEWCFSFIWAALNFFTAAVLVLVPFVAALGSFVAAALLALMGAGFGASSRMYLMGMRVEQGEDATEIHPLFVHACVGSVSLVLFVVPLLMCGIGGYIHFSADDVEPATQPAQDETIDLGARTAKNALKTGVLHASDTVPARPRHEHHRRGGPDHHQPPG